MPLHRTPLFAGLVLAVSTLSAPLAGCSTTSTVTSHDADRAILLDLNRRLQETQIVDREASLLLETATESFRVLAPGGVVEDLRQAAAGVQVWDAQGVKSTGEEVVFTGEDIATVTGRLEIDGTMPPVGRFGPLKFLTTFVRIDGKWRMISRALTPCLPQAVAAGRC